MAEWICDAWLGWADYTDRGKLPALLLAVLLSGWFVRKWKAHRGLLTYATVTAACCIFPVTAAGLMLYQTRFYDYAWIWSLVPLTAVTAYGVTVWWTEFWIKNDGKWKEILPVTLLLLAALVCCGSLGRPVWDRQAQGRERRQAASLLGQISARYPGAALCLWGPREVMEYAREEDAAIRLPYGRNLWDPSLDAYAYDTYDADTVALARWMECLGGTGEADPEQASGTQVSLEDCAEIARAKGVNCVLLPAGTDAGTVARMGAALGTEAGSLEGFFLFYTGEEGFYGRAD